MSFPSFDSKVYTNTTNDVPQIPHGEKLGKTLSGQKVTEITTRNPIQNKMAQDLLKSPIQEDIQPITSHDITDDVKTEKPSQRPFTSNELHAIEQFAEGLSTVFGIQIEDAMTTYEKMHTASKCQLPEMHRILAQIDEIPENIRNDVGTAAQLLIIKDIGHEWGLSGDIQIGDVKVPMEGGSSVYMLARACNCLDEYFERNSSDLQSQHTSLTQQNQSRLQAALRASIAIGYMNTEKLGDEKSYLHATNALQNLEKNGMVIIPSGWTGHAINIVLYRDHKGNDYLVYTNRGEILNRETLNSRSFDMQVYKITKQITPEMLAKLIARDPNSIKTERMKFFEANEAGGMHKLFGLESIINIEKKGQKVGNCSWANSMGGIHAALFMMLFDKNLERKDEQTALLDAKGESRSIYKSFTSKNRAKQLHDFLALYNKVNSGKLGFNKNDFMQIVYKIHSKLLQKTTIAERETEKKLLQKVDNFLLLHETPEEEISDLIKQKVYKEYSPHPAVWAGNMTQEKDLAKFMDKAKLALVKEGDYVVIQTNTIPEGANVLDEHFECVKQTILITRKKGELKEFPLVAGEKLRGQIDKNLV